MQTPSPGRKPGGASDGEEPEPDGREAQSLSQHDAGSSKSDPGAPHPDHLSVRELVQTIGQRERPIEALSFESASVGLS